MDAFKTMLLDTEEWRVSLDGLFFSKINEVEALRLEIPFTVDEVFTALRDLNGDKGPGLDGFMVAFWHFSWDTTKDKIMRMFKDFFVNGKCEKPKHHILSYGVEKMRGWGFQGL